MTTHQLAALLEHLQLGLGGIMKSGTGFVEAIAALRESPDQSLKELAKKLQSAHEPRPTASRNASLSPVDLGAMIGQIRSVREGKTDGPVTVDPGRLTAPQLKEILRAFQQPVTGTKPALVGRVRQLCAPASRANGAPTAGHASNVDDTNGVEEGVRLFSELRDNKSLSISDVRAQFESFRKYSKPVIEEISRRL